MRTVLIGTVAFSRACLARLVALDTEVVGVVTGENTAFHSDYARLDGLCGEHGIPCHVTRDANAPETLATMRGWRPDVVFCVGWSQLLKEGVLELAPLGVVGYHPSPLPRNRGRHPLIWALALGLEETGSTFFRMDGGVDSGDILSQRVIAIAPEDDAGTLYEKMTATALDQLDDLVPRLADGSFTRTPQDERLANVWRKRGAEDGVIDWRMPSAGIHNLVRALTRPYPGASAFYRSAEFKVWRTAPSDLATPPNLEPGRVLRIDGRDLTVKTGDAAISLTEHDLARLPENGEYL